MLDAKGNVGFEYDGEMAVDVALHPEARRLYPFCRLTGPANVLVMPAIHSAAISTKIAAALGGATVLGPLLVGLKSSVQIAQLDATAQDIVNLAAFAAFNTNG
jgi:malate dehydrogenase (oxaloacetate-decarboxylating)(NADP+)